MLQQKEGEPNIYDEIVEFERGFYRLRISWLPKNGVIKMICRWPILMPSANFAELALAIGRINFGVRVGKFGTLPYRFKRRRKNFTQELVFITFNSLVRIRRARRGALFASLFHLG
jgi:hypothetical protein